MKNKNNCEIITITRMESERVRMRKTTDKGSDVGLILPKGAKIHHGDIIYEQTDRMIIVQIAPENILKVTVKNNLPRDHVVEVPVIVGHTIGNLHRPLKLDGDKVYFPIQTDDEVAMFRKLFSPIINHLELEKVKMVFEPEEALDVHEH